MKHKLGKTRAFALSSILSNPVRFQHPPTPSPKQPSQNRDDN